MTGLDRRQFPELPKDGREWQDAKLAFELNTIILKLCAADVKQRYAGNLWKFGRFDEAEEVLRSLPLRESFEKLSARGEHEP